MPSPNADENWSDYAVQLGLRIQARRIELGVSQEQLAYAAGVSRYSVQRFEKGRIEGTRPVGPSLRSMLAIAQVLEVELHDLLPNPVPDLRAGSLRRLRRGQ